AWQCGFPSTTSFVFVGIVTIGILSYFSLLFKFRTYEQLKNANEAMTVEIDRRQDAEEFYRSILESSTDGFLLLDPSNGRILDANTSYLKMLGYSKKKLTGINYADLDTKVSEEEQKQRMQALISDGGLQFEAKHACSDGSELDVEVSANYINQKGGRAFAFIRNISDRKKRENELQERTEELLRMNRAMINRELKMRELKSKLQECEDKRIGVKNNHTIDDEEQYWHISDKTQE
ncbi:MAG: PAS domain S-box protein, partial [Candidatus Kerfeldbacteria bacterium]